MEYTYPSDVIRPTTDKDDGDGDLGEDGDAVTTEKQEGEDGTAVGVGEGGAGAGGGEWKSALLNCGWKKTLQRFEEMVRKRSRELLFLLLFCFLRFLWGCGGFRGFGGLCRDFFVCAVCVFLFCCSGFILLSFS